MTPLNPTESLPPKAVEPNPPAAVELPGRVRPSREARQRLLADWERSGLSAAGFARQRGLKYSTLAAWVRQHRRRAPTPAGPSSLRLVEAVLAAAPSGVVLPVQLPGGARLELREAGQIPLAAALVHALATPC